MRALLIGLVAGWADAVGYLQAHTFAAQMTGNIVLLGIALAHRAWSESARMLSVIAAFVTGMVLVLLIARRVGRRSSLLGCAAGMAAIALAGRLSPLMPLLAMCLGGQNAASPRARDQPLNTSFISGDLQKFANALAQRMQRGRSDAGGHTLLTVIPALLCCYVAGASAGALASGHLPYPLLPAAGLLALAVLLPE